MVGEEGAQPQGLRWQLYAWVGQGWVAVGGVQNLGDLEEGQYLDVSETVALPANTTFLHADVWDAKRAREINVVNNQVEWPWPSNP